MGHTIRVNSRDYQQNVIYARLYMSGVTRGDFAVIVKIGMTERTYHERQKEYEPVEPFSDYVARVPPTQTALQAEDKLREFTAILASFLGGHKIDGKRDWFYISYKGDEKKLHLLVISMEAYFCGVRSATNYADEHEQLPLFRQALIEAPR